MGEFWVHAPLGGTLTSHWDNACPTGSRYCGINGRCHPTVFGSNPIDIHCGWSSRLDFWSSPIVGSSTWAVLSVVTSTFSGACLHSGPGAPWDVGMEVKMYSGLNGYGAYLGSIVYAHVVPAFIGVVNTINGGVTYLAYTASSNPPCVHCIHPGTGLCDQPDSCKCYQGSHIHIESVNAIARNTNLVCGSPAVAGSTWLYRYLI